MQGRVLGAYRILRELGRGGMGAVYLAEHTLLGRQAAVKVLLPEYSANQTIVTRFFNEARAAASIRHLGIVEVYDFGFADDGLAYIAMEYLQGESLSQRLARGRLAPMAALVVARQIAGPLAAAHRAGIVHRDLKPDNIFLVPDDEAAGGERVKLLDFGVAKLLGEIGGRDQTHSGAIVGTPNYMAPEQCRGVTVDHRADLYALGCVLFKLLTGHTPFSGEGPGDIMMAHVGAPVPVPSQVQPGLAPALDGVVTRLLAKRPDDRFQRAEDVSAALDACAAGLMHDLSDPLGRSVSSPGAVAVAVGTLTSASHVAPPALAQRRGGRRLVVAGVAAVVVGAAAVSFAMLTGGGDAGNAPRERGASASVAQVAVDAAVDAPAPTMAVATVEDSVVEDSRVVDAAGQTAPPTVVLRITSTPAGATVSVNGEERGPTPLDLAWPRGAADVTIVVRKRGFRAETFTYVPSESGERTVTLRRPSSGSVKPPNPF